MTALTDAQVRAIVREELRLIREELAEHTTKINVLGKVACHLLDRAAKFNDGLLGRRETDLQGRDSADQSRDDLIDCIVDVWAEIFGSLEHRAQHDASGVGVVGERGDQPVQLLAAADGIGHDSSPSFVTGVSSLGEVSARAGEEAGPGHSKGIES